MKYYVTHISIDGKADWEIALLQQDLADRGFDSFMENGDTLEAYIPEHAIQPEQLEGIELIACPDENWNATWEAEHPVQELPLGVKIIPHCAFGAGYHNTTSMMIQPFLNTDTNRQGKRALDMGCGTGVLGIYAAKAGMQVTAIDIDEKAVENTIENAELNGVTLEARQGSTVPHGPFDLIMANIHRNILLEQIADYARELNDGGELWMSGFYADDVDALNGKAIENGLKPKAQFNSEEWQMLVFCK